MDLSISTGFLTEEERQQIEAKVAELNHIVNLRTHYDIQQAYDWGRSAYKDEEEGWLLIQTADVIHPDLNEAALKAFFDQMKLPFALAPGTDFADIEYFVVIRFPSKKAAKEGSKRISALLGETLFDVALKEEGGYWDASDKVKAGLYWKLLDWLDGYHPNLEGVYASRTDFRDDYEWIDRNYFHRETGNLISWKAGELWL